MERIRNELVNLGTDTTNERRRKYFHWKNKLDTMQTKYTEMTKEEFIDWACKGNENKFKYLERWAESDEYKRLEYIYRAERFDDDLLEVYEAIKKEAEKGNSSAVKTFLSLQKEIKKRIKHFDIQDEDHDDGLKLKV